VTAAKPGVTVPDDPDQCAPTSARGAEHRSSATQMAIKLARWMMSRPYVAVAIVAALGRVGFAITSFVLHDPGLFLDEVQYVGLATSVASGRGAEAWAPGYGQSLYDTTRAFMAPLTALFDLLGSSRLIGQLWVATFGVATAVATSLLAGRAAGSRAALLAGLAVALLPSQILWSSVVLRESLVWFALVTIAWGMANWFDETRSDFGAILAVTGGALTLGFTRVQTMLAAVWAVVLVVVVLRRSGYLARTAVALAVAVLVPVVVGIGPGGYDLVERAVPALSTTRTQLSAGADSAFTATTLYRGSKPSDGDKPGGSSKTDQDDRTVVQVDDETAYVVEESINANLRAVPRGAIATTVRPFPWETSSSFALRLAGFENIIWYVFYCLALAGCWFGRKQLEPLAFPMASTAAILGVAFVTQGNLGTAFRHRGQVFWAIAILSAVGLEHLLRRRSAE